MAYRQVRGRSRFLRGKVILQLLLKATLQRERALNLLHHGITHASVRLPVRLEGLIVILRPARSRKILEVQIIGIGVGLLWPAVAAFCSLKFEIFVHYLN